MPRLLSKGAPLAAAAIASMVISAGALHASVISLNYDASTGGGASSDVVTGGTAGVVLAGNWTNSASLTGAALVDNTGTPTTVGYTLNGGFSPPGWNIQNSIPGQDGDNSYNRNMLNDYFNEGSNYGETTQLAISGISYGTYDLYVYFSADTAGRPGTISLTGGPSYDFSTEGPAAISGSNATFAQTADSTGANPAADYAVFSGLTGSSQSLTFDVPNGGGIAGFQIVDTPEPATLGLMIIGGASLLGLKRRRA